MGEFFRSFIVNLSAEASKLELEYYCQVISFISLSSKMNYSRKKIRKSFLMKITFWYIKSHKVVLFPCRPN